MDIAAFHKGMDDFQINSPFSFLFSFYVLLCFCFLLFLFYSVSVLEMNECMVMSTSVALTKDTVLEDGSSSKDIMEPDQSTIHVSTKLLAQTA